MSSTTTTRSMTVCTSCATTFVGLRCPTCGKSIDNIYSENDNKEKLMELVNTRFKTEFSLPSDLFVVPTKSAPTKEFAFVRGLISEQDKIHALSFRLDTGVRVNGTGGLKGCFAYFLAGKDEKFENSVSTDSSVEIFDEETSASTLSVNLFECFSLADLGSGKVEVCVEDLISSIAFALLNIFCALAEKQYFFKIPSDNQLFAELQGNRVVSVKYVVLDNLLKYNSDIANCERKNLNVFCGYIEGLFLRFCNLEKSKEGNFFNAAKSAIAKFEFSWILCKLLMLMSAGKRSLETGIQKITTVEELKKNADLVTAIDFAGFLRDSKDRDKMDLHFNQKIFQNTVDFAFACVKGSDCAYIFDDFYAYADADSSFLVVAEFFGSEQEQRTGGFTAELADFAKEYIETKLFGGPSVSHKSLEPTMFCEKLKNKLKGSSFKFVEDEVTNLARQMCKKAEELNQDDDIPCKVGLSLSLFFKRDNTLHLVKSDVGNGKLFVFDGSKVSEFENEKNDEYLKSDAKIATQKYKVKHGGVFVVLPERSTIDKEAILQTVSEGSAKRCLYNIVATNYLRGSERNCTVFVVK